VTRSASPAGPVRVLFVCTGNICRSPLAATVFHSLTDQAALGGRFRADSAALRPHHLGRPADPRAIAAATKRGYRWLPSVARTITERDFDTGLVVGMGAWHVARLRELAPAGCDTIRSLVDYGEESVPEVPDPYDAGEGAFERALDLIEDGCSGLLRELLA